MKNISLICVALLGVAACDPIAQAPRGPAVLTCESNPSGGCRFDRSPLHVLPEPVTLPRRPWQFFPTAETLNFVDARGQTWTAPRRTLTDGASIPKIFVSIVGDPTAPEFINAAAMHDAYCGIGNEDGPKYRSTSWEATHRMFYDGLIAGGTQPVVAKLMFSAVWLGGPRWNTSRRLDQVPDARLRQAMRETRAFIEANTTREDDHGTGKTARGGNAPTISTQGRVKPVPSTATPDGPPFGTLMRYLLVQEQRMQSEYPVHAQDDKDVAHEPTCTGDDCYDPTLNTLPDLDGDGLPG